MLPLLQKMPDPGLPRSGEMFSPCSLAPAEEWHWWVFLGGCLPASSLSFPPPLPPKIPVLFHCETRRNVNHILVFWPTLPFVIHQTRHGAWHCTSLQTESLGRQCKLESPGMREHELKVSTELTAPAAGWQMLKRLPRSTAA